MPFRPLRDPNWGETYIWGGEPQIDRLPWYEIRAYLKETFASDGVLATNYAGVPGKFFLGEDADQVYAVLKDLRRAYDLILRETEFGTLLRFAGPGYPTGDIQHYGGLLVYVHFAGRYDRSNVNEYWGVLDFLMDVDGKGKDHSQIIGLSNEPLIQMSLFD